MNGPEHFQAAEQLLDRAEEEAFEHGDAWYLNVIQRAQVHATLAQTAAQIEAVAARGPGDLSEDWPH